MGFILIIVIKPNVYVNDMVCLTQLDLVSVNLNLRMDGVYSSFVMANGHEVSFIFKISPQFVLNAFSLIRSFLSFRLCSCRLLFFVWWISI